MKNRLLESGLFFMVRKIDVFLYKQGFSLYNSEAKIE